MEKWLAKLKKIKHIEIYCAVAVIAVMLVIFFSGFTPADNGSAKPTNAAATSTLYTNEELRLANILSQIDGAGRVSVMRTDKGVLIISSGAHDPNVRFAMLRAMQTLLNDNTVRIEIIGSK